MNQHVINYLTDSRVIFMPFHVIILGRVFVLSTNNIINNFMWSDIASGIYEMSFDLNKKKYKVFLAKLKNK